MTNTVLQLNDGVIARGAEALISQVSITLETGEIALLTGPNGSGKSTLLTALAGERFLSSGTLLIDSTLRSELSLKELAKRRSLMLQQDEAVGQLRVKDVLELVDISTELAQYTLGFASQIVDPELSEKTLGSLSVGQRTRVFLAASAIQNCKLMLLDEPTAGLDVDAVTLLSEFLTAHANNGGAVILATHEDTLRSIASKEFVILDGRLIERKLG